MQNPPETALVLDRWNAWVRVFLPRTGEVRWIDLRRAGTCEILDGPPAEGVASAPAPASSRVDSAELGAEAGAAR